MQDFATTDTLAKLLEMKSVKDAAVFLMSTKYSKNWHCTFELGAPELELKISKSGNTLHEAVDECHTAWRALQKGVPDAAPSLLVSPNDSPESPLPF